MTLKRVLAPSVSTVTAAAIAAAPLGSGPAAQARPCPEATVIARRPAHRRAAQKRRMNGKMDLLHRWMFPTPSYLIGAVWLMKHHGSTHIADTLLHSWHSASASCQMPHSICNDLDPVRHGRI